MRDSFCKNLRQSDPRAYALCKDRLAAGDGLKDLDIGADRLDYTNLTKGPGRVWETRPGDGAVSAQEVYRRYLQVVEGEELRRAKSYEKNPRNFPLALPKSLQGSKPAGIHVPFLFNDPGSSASKDDTFFRLAVEKIQGLQGALQAQGMTDASWAYQRQMAVNIFEWIRRPTGQGGLGIQYLSKPDRAARNLAEIFADRKATCVEFTFLFHALGRLAGLRVLPLEVYRNAKGQVVEHVRVGIAFQNPLGQNKMFFLDLADGLAGERQGEVWSEISALDLMAYYYNSQAIAAPKERAAALFRRALDFSPSHYIVLNNLAAWHLDQAPRSAFALYYLQKAQRSHAFYPFIYLGLEKAFRAQGESAKAEAAKLRSEQLFRSWKSADSPP